MCGIAGVLNLERELPISERTLHRMILALRHRGPDEFGMYRDDWVGMASARLNIVDIEGGQQPIGNEDGTLWIVFNGEIYNYLELRASLESRGHQFSTNSDTEVIIHMYEEYGTDCLNQLNGQFAIALWNARDRSLFLARDRMGIRPLFYAMHSGQLIFGSEIKAILQHGAVEPKLDAESLAQVFTYWSPLSPRSIFRDVYETPPGHFIIAHEGDVSIEQYWALDFTKEREPRHEHEIREEFEALLVDATQIRLRADVPVGAYLSGGLDSSVIAAIISHRTETPLDTFSIAFEDPQFDESKYQRLMADFLGTNHQEIYCTHQDIAKSFPEVIWHAETPILRTAPAPMFLLSELVREHQYKVVLTGEGADEVLAGYDIFKEMRIRRFWARQPESQLRPLLFRKIYPDIPRLSQSEAFRMAFFRRELENTDSPFYSHRIRWENTGRSRRFMINPNGSPAPSQDGYEYPIRLPAQFSQWSHLAQAQFLEMTTFLSPYLLSSQGDRMSLAHSVEGRYPFLDHRVVEFCNRLPDHFKQKGLIEKWLLRQVGRGIVPEEIRNRGKKPFRAPIHQTFFASDEGLEFVADLLSPGAIGRSGYFKPEPVRLLVKKARSGIQLSEVDEMALIGILSTQLVDQLFVQRGRRIGDVDLTPSMKVVDFSHQATH
jgi:asparagine synthase (glutamine-hydrolysing)